MYSAHQLGIFQRRRDRRPFADGRRPGMAVAPLGEADGDWAPIAVNRNEGTFIMPLAQCE